MLYITTVPVTKKAEAKTDSQALAAIKNPMNIFNAIHQHSVHIHNLVFIFEIFKSLWFHCNCYSNLMQPSETLRAE